MILLMASRQSRGSPMGYGSAPAGGGRKHDGLSDRLMVSLVRVKVDALKSVLRLWMFGRFGLIVEETIECQLTLFDILSVV